MIWIYDAAHAALVCQWLLAKKRREEKVAADSLNGRSAGSKPRTISSAVHEGLSPRRLTTAASTDGGLGICAVPTSSATVSFVPLRDSDDDWSALSGADMVTAPLHRTDALNVRLAVVKGAPGACVEGDAVGFEPGATLAGGGQRISGKLGTFRKPAR